MTERAVPTIPGFTAGYLDVAGLPTWHEVDGAGPAVILLHGAFSGAAAWSAQARRWPARDSGCMCQSGAGMRTPRMWLVR